MGLSHGLVSSHGLAVFFWGVLGGAVDAVDVISIYSMQKLEVTVPNY